MKKFLKKIVIKLKLMNVFSIFFYIFRIFKIQNNKIVIVNYHGKGYGDNAKYVVESLLKKNENLKIYWALKNTDEMVPKGIKKIKFNSIKYFYHLTTAKVWLNNSRFQPFVRKRKEQYYIQLWHGGLALKKIEYDAYDKMTEYYKQWMQNDSKITNLMISNSTFCTEMYRRAFKYNGKILEVGSPRNDILINNKENMKEKIYNYYNIGNDSKTLLYAPTFRKDYSSNPYNIDLLLVKQKLEEVTNDKWNIIVKFHPIMKKNDMYVKNIDKFIDASNYPDMQELIAGCDILVTDYSSTMFEALIANKIVILYVNDLDKYNEERGTYFDLQELPFNIVKNNNEIIKLIENFNDIDINSYNEFSKKVGLKEEGTASEKVAEKIIKLIKE